jgi:hypothetical protein
LALRFCPARRDQIPTRLPYSFAIFRWLIGELKPHGIHGIALSGYGTEDDVRNSRAAGFALHLVKPVLAEVQFDQEFLFFESVKTQAMQTASFRFGSTSGLRAFL